MQVLEAMKGFRFIKRYPKTLNVEIVSEHAVNY